MIEGKNLSIQELAAEAKHSIRRFARIAVHMGDFTFKNQRTADCLLKADASIDVLAAAQAAAVPQGWMPIETAPTDRSMIVVRAIGVRAFEGAKTAYTSDPYCVFTDDGVKFNRWPHPFPPTHWTAIPVATMLAAAPPAPAPVEPKLKWPWRDAYVDENLPASPAPVAMPEFLPAPDGWLDEQNVYFASTVYERDAQWQAQFDKLMRKLGFYRRLQGQMDALKEELANAEKGRTEAHAWADIYENKAKDLQAQMDALTREQDDVESEHAAAFDAERNERIKAQGQAKTLAAMLDEARAELDALPAALTGAQPLTGWLPIESAPRNGSKILIGRNGLPDGALSFPHEKGYVKMGVYRLGGGAAWEWNVAPLSEPTHWMPFPAMPGAHGIVGTPAADGEVTR